MTKFGAFKDVMLYPLHILSHPAEGFYGMKFLGRGRVKMTVFNLLFFWFSYTFMQEYGSVVVNQSHPLSYNSGLDFVAITSLFILFCAANWTVTSLFNGEGRFKDITMAVAYAFTPMNLLFIPATLLTNVLAETEAAFFTMIVGVAIAYFLILVFVGIMTVHNYSVAKTALTLLATAVSMVIILFIIMLISALIQQVWVFCRSVYVELLY